MWATRGAPGELQIPSAALQINTKTPLSLHQTPLRMWPAQLPKCLRAACLIAAARRGGLTAFSPTLIVILTVPVPDGFHRAAGERNHAGTAPAHLKDVVVARCVVVVVNDDVVFHELGVPAKSVRGQYLGGIRRALNGDAENGDVVNTVTQPIGYA